MATKVYMIAFQVEADMTIEQLHEFLCQQVHEVNAGSAEQEELQLKVLNIQTLDDLLLIYAENDDRDNAATASIDVMPTSDL